MAAKEPQIKIEWDQVCVEGCTISKLTPKIETIQHTTPIIKGFPQLYTLPHSSLSLSHTHHTPTPHTRTHTNTHSRSICVFSHLSNFHFYPRLALQVMYQPGNGNLNYVAGRLELNWPPASLGSSKVALLTREKMRFCSIAANPKLTDPV